LLVFAAPPNPGWPGFRGPNGQGTDANASPPKSWSGKEGAQENLVWKTELPGAGTSTPILVGDHGFVTCYSGFQVPGRGPGQAADLRLHLARFRRSDGKLEWVRDIPARLPEQERIRESHGYASSTPVADSERVFAFFGKSGVHAFDHQGNLLWSAEVGSKLNGWGSAASLLLHDSMVIVNASVESESLIALDAKTGKEIWRAKNIKESWNTPIIVTHEGRTDLVVAIFGKILGLDPKTGAQRWSCATDIPWYMVPSLVAADGVVYAIGGRPGGGLAVRLGGEGDVTATHRIWKSAKGGNVSSPLIHQGHLYWAHDNTGMVYCAEAATGKIVYEERVRGLGQCYGSPVLAGEKILYPSREGTIHVLAATPKFSLLGTNPIGERCQFNSSPALSGNRLFLRTDRFLYCFGTP